MSKCRTCKAPKWRGDICPVCASGIREQGRSHTLPVSVTSKHGFHAPNQSVRLGRAERELRMWERQSVS